MVTSGNGCGGFGLAGGELLVCLHTNVFKEDEMLVDKQTNSRRLMLLITCLLVFTGLSYWLLVRPYNVTKNCQKVALDNSGYDKDTWRAWAGSSENQSNYMFVYEMCMHKEGINP